MEKEKKRRHGPLPRPIEELRQIKKSVYFTAEEYSELCQKAAAVKLHPCSYLRIVGLKSLRPIPEINKEAWVDLSRVCSNLNQYQAAINEGRATGYPPDVLQNLRDQVENLRCALKGVHGDEG